MLDIKNACLRVGYYSIALAKWLSLAVVVGCVCGFVGSLFHLGVEHATHFRQIEPRLLWALPLAGVILVWFYRLTKTEGQGTNDILDAVGQGKRLSFWLLPAIFLATILTHLCGGSAGREGAALQMGGTIGHTAGRCFRLDDRDLRTATICGMAAFFSALFGTPMAASMFAIMVISIGVLYHAAIIPSLVSALVAYGISIWMGIEPTKFFLLAPDMHWLMLFKIFFLAGLCALVSILFCTVLHGAEKHMKHLLPNPYLRIVLGSCGVLLLTFCFGTYDYNGAGMEVIRRAIEEGRTAPFAFLLKILLTAVTLGAGFKGGEVVPSFFIGATFGCAVSPLLGIDPCFGAAVGLVSVFCGATNCPIASVFLSIELFGASGMLYFATACGVSYMLSGYHGLYSSQTILYSKLKSKYINVHTNAHHAGRDEVERNPDITHNS